MQSLVSCSGGQNKEPSKCIAWTKQLQISKTSASYHTFNYKANQMLFMVKKQNYSICYTFTSYLENIYIYNTV